MSSSILAYPKPELIHYIDTIRDYAKRMLTEGEVLEADEAANQMAYTRDFLTTGGEYGLTEKEMVDLVLGEASPKKLECSCPSCNARQQI